MAGYRNTSGDEREHGGDADATRACGGVDEAILRSGMPWTGRAR
jgi:hypothetical protein